MSGCDKNCRSTKIQNEQRKKLIQESPRCSNCDSSDDLELDHMIPSSRGGCNCEENLWVLCRLCNRHKWTLTADEFVESGLARFLRRRQYRIWDAEIEQELNRPDYWRVM